MFDKLQAIIAEQLNLPLEKITKDSRMLEDLGADSLDFVELLMTLEEKFGVTVSDEDAKKLKTVGDVAEFVKANMKK